MKKPPGYRPKPRTRIKVSVHETGPLEPMTKEERLEVLKPNYVAKLKMTTMGVTMHTITSAEPEMRECLAFAKAYVNRRKKEYILNFGFMSAGTAVLLTSSGLALAASRWLYGVGIRKSDAGLLKQAAQLSESSRKQEAEAWETASREMIHRPGTKAGSKGLAWEHDYYAARDDKPKAYLTAEHDVPPKKGNPAFYKGMPSPFAKHHKPKPALQEGGGSAWEAQSVVTVDSQTEPELDTTETTPTIQTMVNGATSVVE